jgi:hypothetical protein
MGRPVKRERGRNNRPSPNGRIRDWSNFPNYNALASLLDPQARSRFIGVVVLMRAPIEAAQRDRPSPLTWAHSQSVSIVLLRPGQVPEGRWEAFIRSFEQASTTRLLLLVLGGVELQATQRRALARSIGDRRVAAVVDAIVGRELVTALNWAGVSVESFPIARLREALGSLDPESDGEPIDLCLDLAARLIGLTGAGAAA